jgi:hypothetical protein
VPLLVPLCTFLLCALVRCGESVQLSDYLRFIRDRASWCGEVLNEENGLKIRTEKSSGGSSPPPGTKTNSNHLFVMVFEVEFEERVPSQMLT